MTALHVVERRPIDVARAMPWHLMRANVQHRDRLGQLLWEAKNLPNVVHDTGEVIILSALFATGMTNYGATVATVYLGVDNRTTPAAADTLATIYNSNSPNYEPPLATNGYARLGFITSGTGAAGQKWIVGGSPAWNALSLAADGVWTCATGNWATAVKNLFLCTHTSAVADADDAHLFCSVALSATRTLLVGDTLSVTLTISPSGT